MGRYYYCLSGYPTRWKEQDIVYSLWKSNKRLWHLLNDLTGKKKVTVKYLQVLTGYLNFLTKAIFAGRTFTRRIYSKFSNLQAMGLKGHHHVKVDQELRFDCDIWKTFLTHYRDLAVCLSYGRYEGYHLSIRTNVLFRCQCKSKTGLWSYL